tara:strand:+ start:1279 stop:2103 length:825 start_codon:yes stop_codon:yes gene_type:complete
MNQLSDILNNIKESNYKEANEGVFDVLYLKIDEKLQEGIQNEKDDGYQKFFQSALKKFGVTQPDQLKGDKKKEFYNYVDKNWKSDAEKETGQEDPKESVELDELGRGTLRRYREKSKKQISDIEKRGMKKGEKVSSKYKKRLKGRRQATTRLAKKAMEGVEVDERHAPLPKSSEFVVHYPMKDNKQVTKLTKLGGKVDRANKRVVFKFDTAAERTKFRKKNKKLLSTITDSFEVEEGAEMDIAKEKEKMAMSQEKIRDLAIQMKKEKQRKRAEA